MIANRSGGPNAPIVVVGAGMAGLTCAAELCAAGREVVVLEASDGVGGRVRTDRHPDGFLLDRGFQVILDAYPALKRQVDLEALRPAAFDAGAHVWNGRRLIPLADPFRHPAALPRDLTTNLFPAGDKLRLAAFALKARLAGWQSAAEAGEGDNRSAAEALWGAGFGRAFVDRFARPFWGGILLDPALGTAVGPLRFTLKMFVQGRAVLPDAGVQAVPQRLARRVPPTAIRLNQPVEGLSRDGERVVGVRVRGATIPATAVVLATDAPTAKRLSGIAALPEHGVGNVTVYLAGERDPGIGRRLALDGTGTLPINQLAHLSAVAPSYAPPGRHLLSAAMLGGEPLAEPDDDVLGRQARDAAATMLCHDPAWWTPLAVVRVPFAQFAQPPGIHARLPDPATSTPGLFLATEATVDSSLNGAILGGETAAAAVLRGTGTGGRDSVASRGRMA